MAHPSSSFIPPITVIFSHLKLQTQMSLPLTSLQFDKHGLKSDMGLDSGWLTLLSDIFLHFYSLPIAIPLTLLCIFTNGTLLLNILIRPVLWSTVNTFLSVHLLLNIIYGCTEFILSDILLTFPASSSLIGQGKKH